MLFWLFSFTHNYSCEAPYPPTGHYPCAALCPLLCSRFPQTTEQIFHKSPNKSSTNNRTNLPQITEKSVFSLNEKQAATSLQSKSSYTLQLKYIAAIALPARRALPAALLPYTLHSSFTRPQGLTRSSAARRGHKKAAPRPGLHHSI